MTHFHILVSMDISWCSATQKRSSDKSLMWTNHLDFETHNLGQGEAKHEWVGSLIQSPPAEEKVGPRRGASNVEQDNFIFGKNNHCLTVQGTALSYLNRTHFIFTSTTRNYDFFCSRPHFTDEKTETQQGEVACPRSQLST